MLVAAPAQAAIQLDLVYLIAQTGVSVWRDDSNAHESGMSLQSWYSPAETMKVAHASSIAFGTPAWTADSSGSVAVEVPSLREFIVRSSARQTQKIAGGVGSINTGASLGGYYYVTLTDTYFWEISHSLASVSPTASFRARILQQSGGDIFDAIGTGAAFPLLSGQLGPGSYIIELGSGGGIFNGIWTPGEPTEASFAFDSLYRFTLTPLDAIPEPAIWAMMIAGFGLAGAAMRRARIRRAAFA